MKKQNDYYVSDVDYETVRDFEKSMKSGNEIFYQFDNLKDDFLDYFKDLKHRVARFKKELINIDKYGNLTYLLIRK